MGPAGYAVVLMADVAKGALIGEAAKFMGMPPPWAFAAALSVVIGHVWPVWLGFRGGKGIGPFLGAWLVLAPLSLAPCLVLALILWPWFRKFAMAGLAGISILPSAAWFATGSRSAVVASCGTFALLLWSHRVNIRKFAADRFGYGTAPTP